MPSALKSLILVATSCAWLSASAVVVAESGHDLAFELTDDQAPPTRGLFYSGEELLSEGFEDDCDFERDTFIAPAFEVRVLPVGECSHGPVDEQHECIPSLTDRLVHPARGPPSC